jgi:hypothetical protein
MYIKKQVFDKILKIDQLAGKERTFSLKPFRSSETTSAEISFNFSDYYGYQPEHIKDLDLSFLI